MARMSVKDLDKVTACCLQGFGKACGCLQHVPGNLQPGCSSQQAVVANGVLVP